MTFSSDGLWDALARWRSTAFLVGGAMFVVTAGFNAADVAGGAGHTRLPLKQAFIGVGWTVGLVGLLGLYPDLVDRSRRLIRAGAVFTVVGILGYALMTVVSLAVFAGVLGTGLDPLAPLFLPPVLVGSVLTFPLFGAVILRSGARSRALGALLPGPSVLFVANVLTPTPPGVVLGVAGGLTLVFFGIGYLLRTGAAGPDAAEPAPEPTAK